MDEPIRFGGKPHIRLAFFASPDVSECVRGATQGGQKLEPGLTERIARLTDGRIQVELLEMASGAVEWELARLVADPPEPGAVDVVLRSIYPDIIGAVARGEVSEASQRGLGDFARYWKRAGAHVLFLNASTVDPTDQISRYHDTTMTMSLAAQQLNLALMELSIVEGVSIIDVDRIGAELGAGRHVERALSYSALMCDAVADELVRVLADYGFFENRALVPQVGQRKG